MIAHASNPIPPDGPSGPVLLPLQAVPAKAPGPQADQAGGGEGSSAISAPSGSDLPFAHVPFAISPQGAALLEDLVAAPSVSTFAASRALSLTALALWLQQPQIAAAHEALLHLRALDRRTWQDEVTKEAIETLRETMKASEDPIERRRCANTILRALTRSNRPQQSRVGNHAEGAPNPTRAPATTTTPSGPLSRPHQTEKVGERAPSSPPSSVPPSPHSVSSSLSLSVSDPQASSPKPQAFPAYDYEKAAAESEARQTALRTDPTCPEVIAALDNKKPAPFPEDFATTPESCADHAVARLCNIPNPTGHRLYLAIYDALDIDLRDTPGHWEPFKRALEASHFAKCRPLRAPSASSGSGPDDDQAWTRTNHPLERQPAANTATRKYTFTNDTTGETRSCTLALAPRRAKVDNPNHWWITHLITHNTS